MKKSKQAPSFYEGMDPEVREALLEVPRRRKTGELRSPPSKETDCHTLEDLCYYVFKLVHLDGSGQLSKAGGTVKTWVWFGHDFSDRLVQVVERIAPRLPDKDRLEELRLVATHVTEPGAQRLRSVFPRAMLKVFTDEEDKRNWKLSQAAHPAP